MVTLHVSVWVEICYDKEKISNATSHAPRERVSWNTTYSTHEPLATSHAPRERVSWNKLCIDLKHCVTVTLHVSVWVEICVCYVLHG